MDPTIATVTAAAMESNTDISNATDAHMHDVNTSTPSKSKSSGLSKN